VLGWLPEPALAVLPGVLTKNFSKTLGKMGSAMVKQLTSAELAHVVQRVFQPFLIEIDVKDDSMQVGGHNHVSVDRQVFIADTLIKTVCDDFTGDFVDENGQPFHDGEGQIVHTDIADNAVAFHGKIIRLF
jgi:hypothetical protein